MQPEYSIILTVYKRNNLEEQIEKILGQQGIIIKNIFVFQNESHVDVTDTIKKYQHYDVKHIHNTNVNTKFHGRFTVPLWCPTQYWAIFDDDTMPNPQWLLYAAEKSLEYNGAIIGANGRWADKSGGVGDGGTVQSDTFVDTVGHCWVFPQERIYTMFRDPSFTLDNAEDIHFCCAAMLYDDVRCVVPRLTPYDTSTWPDTNNSLGHDEHATYKNPEHKNLREGCYEYWKQLGWKPL